MAESFIKTLKRDHANLIYRADSKTVMVGFYERLVAYKSYSPLDVLGGLSINNAVHSVTIVNLNIPTVLDYGSRTERQKEIQNNS